MAQQAVPIVMTILGVGLTGIGIIGMSNINVMSTNGVTVTVNEKRIKRTLSITTATGGILTIITAVLCMTNNKK